MILIDIETIEKFTPQIVKAEIALEDVYREDIEGIYQYIRDNVEQFSNKVPYIGQRILEGKHIITDEGLVSDYRAVIQVNYNDYYINFMLFFDRIQIEIQNLESLIQNV